ncbi:hypothetical protein ACFXA3_00410 [Streptomyces sp. NPDC059456]|uniref:hypothetical protein n=1 Tax=Streptomyces sp. NPDC059456 TaxID=3346838 RepID=UPI0036A15582
MTEPVAPIDWARQQQTEREQQSARKLLGQMSDRELTALYNRAETAERHFQLTASHLEEVLVRLRQTRAALAAEAELSAHAMRLRSDMAAERFAWQERGDRVEEANDRVRAELDRIEAAVRDNPTNPDFDGAYLAALRHIRAALDKTKETCDCPPTQAGLALCARCPGNNPKEPTP